MVVKRRPALIRFEPLGDPNRESTPLDFASLIAAGGRDLRVALGGPRSVLQAYEDYRDDSPPGQIFAVANPLHDEVDAVVVAGPRHLWRPAEAILAGTLQPHFNEYERADRGGKPRMYFIDSAADPDTIASLLDRLMAARGGGTVPHHRWALLLLDSSGESSGSMFEYRRLVCAEMIRQLAANSSFDPGERGAESCRRRLLIVTNPNSELHQKYGSGGCRFISVLPNPAVGRTGAAGRTSFAVDRASAVDQVFATTTLLPVALAAIDIMKLLEGAMQLTDEFLETPAESVLGRVTQFIDDVQSSDLRLVTHHQSLVPLTDWCQRTRRWGRNAGRDSAAEANPAAFYLTGGNERMDRIEALSGQLDAAIIRGAKVAADRADAVGLLHLPTIDSHGIGQLLQCPIAARLLLDLLTPI